MMVRVILYKTKHGSTRKIGKVINQYIGDCLLMNLDDVDYSTLEQADMIKMCIRDSSKWLFYK